MIRTKDPSIVWSQNSTLNRLRYFESIVSVPLLLFKTGWLGEQDETLILNEYTGEEELAFCHISADSEVSYRDHLVSNSKHSKSPSNVQSKSLSNSISSSFESGLYLRCSKIFESFSAAEGFGDRLSLASSKQSLGNIVCGIQIKPSKASSRRNTKHCASRDRLEQIKTLWDLSQLQ